LSRNLSNPLTCANEDGSRNGGPGRRVDDRSISPPLVRQPNISVATNTNAMEDDIIYEKAVEILNPGRLYFALKAMRSSPVKISFDMGDLNLTSGPVSSLISIEGDLPEEVQAMQWLVPLEDLKILQDLIPPDTYYWENRAHVLEWQCDLVVDSTIDEKNPLETLDQEEEYRDQLLVTNREYRELQMALDDCNSHIPQVLFSIYPDRLNFAFNCSEHDEIVGTMIQLRGQKEAR
jgi:hypothetical protein